MSTAAVSKFITDIAMHYPKKHETRAAEKAWLQSMAAHLRGYSDLVLARAAQTILDHRKERFFPLPSECKDACEAARQAMEAVELAHDLPALRSSLGDEWSTERVKLAYDLVKSGMGKQAARDNPCWILGLWHFCRKNQRLPEAREVDKIRRDAEDFDRSYRDCVIGDAGPFSKSLEKLGATMLAKREKLRAEVLGR